MKKIAILLLVMTLLLSGCGVFVWNATTEAPKETGSPETTTAVVPVTAATEPSASTGETTLSPEMQASLEASMAAALAESMAESLRAAAEEAYRRASEEASRMAAEEASRIAAEEASRAAAASEEASRLAAEASRAAEEAARAAAERASYLAYADFLEANRDSFDLVSYMMEYGEWFDLDAYRRMAFVDVTGDGFPEMILAVPMDNSDIPYYSPMLSLRIYTVVNSEVKELCKEDGDPILREFWDQTFAHDMTDTVLYLSEERLFFYRQSGGSEGGEGGYTEEFGQLDYNAATHTLSWSILLFHQETYSISLGCDTILYQANEESITEESFRALKQEALKQIDQFVMHGLGNNIETAPMGNFDCIYEEGTVFLSMTWDEAIAYLRNR